MVNLWVLNLDAELELARPGSYAPTREVQAHVARFAAAARALLGEGDLELGPTPTAGVPPGLPGHCWCPTASALERLRACAARPVPAPSLDVLRRVVERGFASNLREEHTRGGYARSPAEVRELLADARAGEDWLLKRGFSLAGRGRRPVRAGALSDADHSWIEAACGLAGVQVEPRRELLAEFALHGRLAADGSVQRGELCVQTCGPRGDWRSTRLARPAELGAAEAAALERAFLRCVRALGEAGYHGPFGLDAYRHTRGFQPLSELNARYSMGWSVGFGRRAQVSAAQASAS